MSCCRSEHINSALSRTVLACDSAAHCANMSSAAIRERAGTSASDSSGSSTSTYRYSHEPWESFQDKEYTLALHTFSHAKSTDIEIHRMRGGRSNRSVDISVRTPSPPGSCSSNQERPSQVYCSFGLPVFSTTPEGVSLHPPHPSLGQ
jgi:hypothetical protein